MTSLRPSNTAPAYKSILGKTKPKNYPLLCHLLDTAAVVEALWNQSLSGLTKNTIRTGILNDEDAPITMETTAKLVAFCAGMHDIGKGTPHWQRRVLQLPLDHYSLQRSLDSCLPLPEHAQEGMGVHQRNSAVYFSNISNRVSSALGDQPVNDGIAMCLQGHHGLYEDFSPNEIEKIIHGIRVPEWEATQQEIEQEILAVLDISPDDFVHIDLWETPSIILTTGIVILADWIASRSDFILHQKNYDDPKEHYQRALAYAESFISGWGLERREWRENIGWTDIFPLYTEPMPFQQSVIDAVESKQISGAGLLMISAPMGAGKTETSLYAAANLGKDVDAKGIWMNLPTQATADAMFSRAIQVAGKVLQGDNHSVALLHSNASSAQAIESISRKNYRLGIDAITPQDQLLDGDMCTSAEENDSTNLFISEFLIEKRLGGMSDITVGTVDQMIKATTRLKHNQLRWLAVSENVVLLDEIHDFDPYTFGLIKKHVSWCGALGVPVIAISATLSGDSQRELVRAYWAGRENNASPSDQERFIEESIPLDGIGSPAWFFAPLEPTHIERNQDIEDEVYPLYTTRLPVVKRFVPYVKRLVHTVVNDNKGQALVVCNTVDQAVETYNALSERGYEAILLHSRMPQEDKAAIVDRILQMSGKPQEGLERKPYVLVSTQIVQQSMDIDFDVLISAFAPLDETLQRIGRIHRHDQKGNRSPVYENAPEVYLLVPPFLETLFDGENSEEDFVTGIVPYSKWEQMSSYTTLMSKKEPKGQWHWDVKGSIQDVYHAHTELYEIALQGTLNNPFLSMAFTEYYSERLRLESIAKQRTVSIANPLEDDLVGFTSEYTQNRKDAPQTRLIDETVVLLPVWKSGSRWYMNPDLSYEITPDMSLKSLQHIGLRSINTTKKFAEQIDISEKFTLDFQELQEHLPPYVTPFYAPASGNKIVLDDILGLVRVRPSHITWL